MTLFSRPALATLALITAFAAVLLGLAVMVPSLMDGNRLRPEIEAATSAALGRKVTISGPISGRLLPNPVLVVGGLTVGDVSAESLRVQFRLLPLLAGRREIDQFTLTGGRIGPVEEIEAEISPAGAISATGRATLSNGEIATLALDGLTDFRSGSGKLRLSAPGVQAESPVSVTPDEVSLPEMAITLGRSHASASIVASLGVSPVQIDINVKAGELDLDAAAAISPAATAAPSAPPVSTPVAATPPAVAGGFALPRDITANLTLAAQSIHWRGLTLDRVGLSALLDNGVLSLGHASAQIQGDALAELSGTLTAKGGQPAFDGSLRATTSRSGLSSQVALRGSRITLSNLALAIEDIHATGDANISVSPPMAVTARLSALGLNAGFDGRLAGATASGTASLHAASFAQAARLLSGSYHPRTAGPLDITAHLTAGGDSLAFDQLQARLGEAVLAGQGRLAWTTGAPALTADLTCPLLALAPFLPADAKPLGLKAWTLEKASTHLTYADGTTTLEHLSGRLLGGDLAGNAKANATGLSGGFAIQGADIGGLELGAGGIKATRGRLDGQARLAVSARQLTTLTGDGRFDIKDGVVQGFDLAAMDAQMRRPADLGGLLGLVQTGLSGGSSRFSSLSASFHADRGVVTSRDIKLDAAGGGATGTALIDLPKDTIDARFAFKLATPDSPPLGLRLEGRLEAPNKIIDINALQRYLVEHGLGKALKGKGGGLIETLLGVKPRDKKQ